jgi:hypothetical protein
MPNVGIGEAVAGMEEPMFHTVEVTTGMLAVTVGDTVGLTEDMAEVTAEDMAEAMVIAEAMAITAAGAPQQPLA